MTKPPDFDARWEEFRGRRREVLVSRTDGPPVIILHEVFGLTETVVAFCRLIAAAGFRVHAPVLFGSSEPVAGAAAKAGRSAQFLCVAHQFRTLASDRSGPWADWLRDLLAKVCEERGAPGAGVVGLCLTGNFALAMAKDRRVLAPVLGEPSLPFGNQRGLHLAPDELAAVKRRIDDPQDGLVVRGYRYATDKICGQAKFDRLRQEFGHGFVGTVIPADENLHSVFTEHLRDEAGALRHDKVAEVIEFFRSRLGPG